MQFTSFSFFVFFLIVVPFYYAFPHRWRLWFLLLASVVFYMAFVPYYVLVIGITIGASYLAGRLLEPRKGMDRKMLFLAGVGINIGLLFVFKYAQFFAANVAMLVNSLGGNYAVGAGSWVLPLGISFHTFQALSYLVEVYTRRIKAERDVGIFSLYILFFPQLVAGPIERPQHMLNQFREHHVFDETTLIEGLKLMLLGFFKKLVIADRLAVIVNRVYAAPAGFEGVPLLVATVAFAFQIYCDFSGYTDIALGAARVLGFNLTNNFRYPYLATSVTDFWQRWHISLSTWFRDYVYIPLGGNRVPFVRRSVNILITFLLSGLWHGASWTFVVWGGLHGLAIVIQEGAAVLRSSFAKRLKYLPLPPLPQPIAVICTFVFVCLAWVFFRANTLSDGLLVVTRVAGSPFPLVGRLLTGDISGLFQTIEDQMRNVELTAQDIALSAGQLYFLGFMEVLTRQKSRLLTSRWFSWMLSILLAMAILNWGVVEDIPFIYFQF